MGQERGKELGQPSYASSASRPPDKVGPRRQWDFASETVWFNLVRTIRIGSNGARPSSSPASKSYWRGEGLVPASSPAVGEAWC